MGCSTQWGLGAAHVVPCLLFSPFQVNLNTIKRCLLVNYNPDSQELDFRH